MKNYTSSVSPDRTIAQIEVLLIKAGARSISKEYDKGEIVAVNFTILCPETKAPLGVRLPADAEAVFQVFKKQRTSRSRWNSGWEEKLRDQAKRTAWRLTYDWVAVQLSMIEMRQAELLQVFLPYLWAGKTTFYESLKQDRFKALSYNGEPSEEIESDAELV